MDRLEIAAALLGLANVVLVARRSLWNYPFGIVMVILYVDVFFRAGLYSEALLQIFFLVVQIYGWWNWSRSREESGEVVVLTLTWSARVAWLTGCLLITIPWGWLTHHYLNAAYPWWDGSIAVLSVAAQILLSRRFFENWVLWIAVDVSAIGLYLTKGMMPTMALYVVFLLVSCWGLVSWARHLPRARHAA